MSLKAPGDAVSLVVRGVAERAADRVNDAGLDLHLQEHRVHAVGNLETVVDSEEHVADAALLDLRQYAYPALRGRTLPVDAGPDAPHVVVVLQVGVDRHVERTVGDWRHLSFPRIPSRALT